MREGDPGACSHDVALSLLLSPIGSHPPKVQANIHARRAAPQRGGRGDQLPRSRAVGQKLNFVWLGHCHVALGMMARVGAGGPCARSARRAWATAPFLRICRPLPSGFCAGVWQECTWLLLPRPLCRCPCFAAAPCVGPCTLSARRLPLYRLPCSSPGPLSRYVLFLV